MAVTSTQNGNSVVFNKSIDQVLETLPVGSISRAIGNSLYGINLTQTGSAVPQAKDANGFVFFTRPQLNLSTLNISNSRQMFSLLTKQVASYQMYTRLMLDPRLGYNGGLSSPFVDPLSAFIPALTNNIKSISGWPDMSAPVYTSEAGNYGEEISFVDGVTNNYEAFDLDVTFRNTRGNPLIYMFYIWIKYQTLVYEGILNPYLDFITENEIDYNTRIYRILTDPTKRYVTNLACTGASFPINVPSGSLFDLNMDTPFNLSSEINIRFRSNCFRAFEDITKLDFNEAMAIFNPNIRKILETDLESKSYEQTARDDATAIHAINGCDYVKIPHFLKKDAEQKLGTDGFYSFNYRSYPYINLATNELEWWIPKTHLKA